MAFSERECVEAVKKLSNKYASLLEQMRMMLNNLSNQVNTGTWKDNPGYVKEALEQMVTDGKKRLKEITEEGS